VRTGGQAIYTTGEHPFWVKGKGWTCAKDLLAGDRLRSHNEILVVVEDVHPTLRKAVVYNLRINEHHTYFIGGKEWGFSVWAHNACDGVTVTRWPGNQGLQPGNWVMRGGKNYWNYLMSGKYQPVFNEFASYSSGVEYPGVQQIYLNWPKGWIGTVQGLIGQRIYVGPFIPPPVL